jgi:hypothetical protein
MGPASRRKTCRCQYVAGKLITKKTEKWGEVIRAANIKPE